MSHNPRFLIVCSDFTRSISDALLEGARETLLEAGVDEDHIDVVRVPGSFEIPVVAAAAARRGRYEAIICLGCVIRGETSHYDFVAGQTAEGIMRASIDSEVPIIFGVLTTENLAQAQARVGGEHGHKGAYSAAAALHMSRVMKQIKSTEVPR